MAGDSAQKALARAIRRHPHKDGRTWALRTVTSNSDNTVLYQGTASYVDTPIYPIVEELNEYEAQAIGENVRAGDLRLILPGNLTLTMQTILICDNQTVDIIRHPAIYQEGHVQQYKLYVRRRNEEQEGT